MPMGTIAEEVEACLRARLRNLTNCVGGAVASTFTLYRRTLTAEGEVAPRTDLGVQTRPAKQQFDPVVVDEPCVFTGTSPKGDRWTVHPEGQSQQELVTLYTVYADIREGDNLTLAYDGKTYLVRASSYAGPLRRCFLDSSRAQK
jgi:hypothetical protein